MTVKPRTRTAGVSHGGATNRRPSDGPVRSIEDWERFSRATVAIVTWLRGSASGSRASVRQAVRRRASPKVLDGHQDRHEKSGPEGPLFMIATWTVKTVQLGSVPAMTRKRAGSRCFGSRRSG